MEIETLPLVFDGKTYFGWSGLAGEPHLFIFIVAVSVLDGVVYGFGYGYENIAV
jgi:hypothetical protein